MSPTNGCGHPACCQKAFGQNSLQHEQATSAVKTLYAALLVFFVPVALFVFVIATTASVFSPLITFAFALVASVVWLLLLWVCLRFFQYSA